MRRWFKRGFLHIHLLPALVSLTVFLHESPSALAEDPGRDTLFQTSTMNALKAGLNGGITPYSQLKQQGDFGIGTVDGLDGEMLALDGGFHQIRSDGTVHPIPDTQIAPYATLTFFDSETRYDLNGPLSYKDLMQWLDTRLTTTNVFYAVKITGTFTSIKTRSVPKQVRPFPPLVEALKKQTIFPLQNVEGTMVGFRFPIYVKGVNTPGYHFHFLTQDRSTGGHVLDLQIQQVVVEIDTTHYFSMRLPETPDFYNEDLSNERIDALENPQSLVDDFVLF